MSTQRRKYDREFKMEAVRLIVEEGRKPTEVAKNLGVKKDLLYQWKQKYLVDPKDSFPGKGHLKPAEEESRRLKRELRNVEEERDILKKALAIFSTSPR